MPLQMCFVEVFINFYQFQICVCMCIHFNASVLAFIGKLCKAVHPDTKKKTQTDRPTKQAKKKTKKKKIKKNPPPPKKTQSF